MVEAIVFFNFVFINVFGFSTNVSREARDENLLSARTSIRQQGGVAITSVPRGPLQRRRDTPKGGADFRRSGRQAGCARAQDLSFASTKQRYQVTATIPAERSSLRHILVFFRSVFGVVLRCVQSVLVRSGWCSDQECFGGLHRTLLLSLPAPPPWHRTGSAGTRPVAAPSTLLFDTYCARTCCGSNLRHIILVFFRSVLGVMFRCV